MNAIIEWLYFEQNNETRSDSAESMAALRECRAGFAKFCPNPTLEQQNRIDDVMIEYGAVERREGFVDGFKLMGEVYAAPDSSQRGES